MNTIKIEQHGLRIDHLIAGDMAAFQIDPLHHALTDTARIVCVAVAGLPPNATSVVAVSDTLTREKTMGYINLSSEEMRDYFDGRRITETLPVRLEVIDLDTSRILYAITADMDNSRLLWQGKTTDTLPSVTLAPTFGDIAAIRGSVDTLTRDMSSFKSSVESDISSFKEELNDTLALHYPTISDVATELEHYPKKSDLADAIAPLATKEELSSVSGGVSQAELEEAIAPLATKDELSSIPRGVSQAELESQLQPSTNHIADRSNPHAVTAEQVGITRNSEGVLITQIGSEETIYPKVIYTTEGVSHYERYALSYNGTRYPIEFHGVTYVDVGDPYNEYKNHQIDEEFHMYVPEGFVMPATRSEFYGTDVNKTSAFFRVYRNYGGYPCMKFAHSINNESFSTQEQDIEDYFNNGVYDICYYINFNGVILEGNYGDVWEDALETLQGSLPYDITFPQGYSVKPIMSEYLVQGKVTSYIDEARSQEISTIVTDGGSSNYGYSTFVFKKLANGLWEFHYDTSFNYLDSVPREDWTNQYPGVIVLAEFLYQWQEDVNGDYVINRLNLRALNLIPDRYGNGYLSLFIPQDSMYVVVGFVPYDIANLNTSAILSFRGLVHMDIEREIS